MSLHKLAALIVPIFLLASCASFERPRPPLPGKWVPIPELSDEFEGGALDAAKWLDHYPGWNGRPPGFFSPANVSVRGGKLHLTARAEDLPNLPAGYHTFTTAAVKSKASVLYGYFEVKARPMRSKASSGFWFNKGEQGWWTEIDVFEVGPVGPKHGSTVYSSAHVFRAPGLAKGFSKPHGYPAPFDIAGDDHVYGLLWTREKIVWYVDGVATRELENTHWHRPLDLNLNSEIKETWFGLPDKSELPATFSIEYVRAWKQTESVAKGEPE